jgi:hypothetical protein
MLIDKMHSEAIRSADSSKLAQTVFRVGNDWNHTPAVCVDWNLRNVKQPVLVVTWLPANYFA